MRPTRLLERLERGQSMVEYAFVLVPFFLLVFGVFDLSRAVFYQHLLTNAVREAARYGAAAQRTPAAVCQVAVRATAGSLPGVDGAFDCSGAAGGPVADPPLTVTVTRDPIGTPERYVGVQLIYTFQPITPLIGSAIGGSAVLSASSSMFIEPE
jgi:Flp pilus assembly protein TadG